MTWSQAIDYLLSVRRRAELNAANGFRWPPVAVVDEAIRGSISWSRSCYKSPEKIYCEIDRAIYFVWAGNPLDVVWCYYTVFFADGTHGEVFCNQLK